MNLDSNDMVKILLPEYHMHVLLECHLDMLIKGKILVFKTFI